MAAYAQSQGDVINKRIDSALVPKQLLVLVKYVPLGCLEFSTVFEQKFLPGTPGV